MQVLLVIVGLALVGVGLVFAVTGVGGDQAEGEGRGLTLKAPAWLFLVVIGVLLMWFAGTRDWNGDDTANGGTTSPPPTTTVVPTTSSGPDTTTDGSASEETTTSSALSGCVVGIGNPLASIRADTNQLSRELADVPAGTYEVIEIRDVVFVVEQRWFLIDVDGQEGWIMDSSFNIDSKTPECNA